MLTHSLPGPFLFGNVVGTVAGPVKQWHTIRAAPLRCLPYSVWPSGKLQGFSRQYDLQRHVKAPKVLNSPFFPLGCIFLGFFGAQPPCLVAENLAYLPK